MDRIDALRMLIDISETGTFSAVARQRTIATSTVALAINQLEQETGARLMTRSTRRLTFTPEGEALLEEARRIVSAWDSATTGLRENGPLVGSIRITASNDFGRVKLRPLLDAFLTRYAGVNLTLLLSDNAVDLLEERIDVAIRSGPLPDSSYRARLLVRGKRLVCASPQYWARAGRPPQDLLSHNCMILARPGAPLSPWPFREGDRVFNVKVKGNRQTSDGDVLRQWAIEGFGVIVKNQWDIVEDIQAGRLETALDEYAAGQIDLFAVQPPGRPSRRAALLVDFLAESFADLG